MISQPVSSLPPPFSIALLDLANSRPVHSLMLSSHLFFCLACLLPDVVFPPLSLSALSSYPLHCLFIYPDLATEGVVARSLAKILAGSYDSGSVNALEYGSG